MILDSHHLASALISSELETPTVYLSLDRVCANIQSIRNSLRGVEVWYAIKCNPDPALVHCVAEHADGFEVASTREVETLLAMHVPPSKMMCMHPIKSPDFIRLLQQNDIRVLAADSREEIEQIADLHPQAAIAVRVSVPGQGSRIPLGEKFGCDPESAIALIRQARQSGLAVAGITMHVGSQCESVENWRVALSYCSQLCRDLAADEPAGLVSRIESLERPKKISSNSSRRLSRWALLFDVRRSGTME